MSTKTEKSESFRDLGGQVLMLAADGEYYLNVRVLAHILQEQVFSYPTNLRRDQAVRFATRRLSKRIEQLVNYFCESEQDRKEAIKKLLEFFVLSGIENPYLEENNEGNR